jgi:dTDP-4-dehydrorhamnose 3,5-epimerase-like enzyme
MKKCTLLTPEIYEDSRGIIRSFYPDENIVEYNLMITKKGDARGYHYHPHFNEYMIIVEGECLFKEYDAEIHEHILIVGDSIRIPVDTAHTFIALTDFKFVSLLTRRWHDSNPPIVKVDEYGKPI